MARLSIASRVALGTTLSVILAAGALTPRTTLGSYRERGESVVPHWKYVKVKPDTTPGFIAANFLTLLTGARPPSLSPPKPPDVGRQLPQ